MRRFFALAALAGGCSEHHAAPVPAATTARAAEPIAAASASAGATRPATPPATRPQLDGRAFPDKVLALTWDDGPDAHTLELARYLHAQRVSATFFVVEAWVDGVSADPGEGTNVFATGHAALPILGELVELGHRLGNHTKNHVLLGDLAPAEVVRQLREDQAAIAPFATGGLRAFRAPGGVWSATASAAVDADPELSALVGPFRWDVDAKDWEGSRWCRSSQPAVECERAAPGGGLRVKPAVIARRYLAQIEAAGHGIVLLHDRVGHVGSRYALDVARALVPALRAGGYVFAAPRLAFGPLAPRRIEPAPSAPAAPAPPWSAGGGFAVEPDSVRVGDLNGDGMPDACARAREGVVCALATPRGLASASVWLAAGAPHDEGGAFDLRDVDGDGRADLCEALAEGVACALSP